MRKLLFVVFVLLGSTLMGQTCKLSLYLKNETGAPIPNQKFSILYADGNRVGEWSTNTEGLAVIFLEKNKTFKFTADLNKRLVSTEFEIGDEDQVSFELALAVPDPITSDTVQVVFYVTDAQGVSESETKISVKEGTNVVFSCTTGVDGLCEVKLLKSKKYVLVIEKFGKTFEDELDIDDDPDLVKFTYHLTIKVVERYTRSFVLDNVYFDYDKWDIKAESHASLDKLLEMMKGNSKMKIEIGGHTDSDGDDPYNMQLSQKRADAVKNYLVTRGITNSRILTKGYGETVPIATNSTPEGKAKNRRTEVKVIEE